MKTIYIKIKEQEYKFKFTQRATFLYERLTGIKSLEDIYNSLTSYSNQITYFYCLILANNPDMSLTFDQFIDSIDDGDINVSELNEYLNEELQKQQELRDKSKDNDKNKKSTKAGSKKK